MKILAILRPRQQDDVRAAVMKHADAELRALWSLYGDGVVREMYSPGGPGAVLVLEADSLREAASRLGELPLIAHDVMVAELIELHPFGALEMLFSDSPGPTAEP